MKASCLDEADLNYNHRALNYNQVKASCLDEADLGRRALFPQALEGHGRAAGGAGLLLPIARWRGAGTYLSTTFLIWQVPREVIHEITCVSRRGGLRTAGTLRTQEREEAKALLRDIRSTLAAQGAHSVPVS